MPSQLNQLLVEEEELQSSFNQVKIGVWDKQFTMAPKDLWDENQTGDLLAFLFGENGRETKSQTFFDEAITGVFAIDKEVAEWGNSHYNHAKLTHSSIPLLNHYRKLNAFNGKSKVYANFHESYVELTVISDGNLKFHNRYNYQTKEDIVYYVLLVYDQMNLDRGEIPLILGGEILQDSNVYQLLYRYISQLQFARLPENLIVEDSSFDQVHMHEFVNLLSMTL